MNYSLKVVNLGGCTFISVKTAFATVLRILILDNFLSFGTFFGLPYHGKFSSLGGKFDFQEHSEVTGTM